MKIEIKNLSLIVDKLEALNRQAEGHAVWTVFSDGEGEWIEHTFSAVNNDTHITGFLIFPKSLTDERDYTRER